MSTRKFLLLTKSRSNPITAHSSEITSHHSPTMSGSYLEDLGLNSLSPIMAPHAGSVDDDPDEFDLDLSLFTNSTFFDADYGSVEIQGGESSGTKSDGGGQIGGLTGFSDFECFEPFQDFPPLPAFAVGDALEPIPSFGAAPKYLPITTAPPASQASSPVSHGSPLSGAPRAKKQKTSSPSSPPVVAAEDKRRRNTAASARFRVKKKQREQQLQETLKETVDKAQRLEERVVDLERENRWLKNLVVEKKETANVEEGVKPEMLLKLE